MSLRGKILRVFTLVLIFFLFWAFFTYNNLLRFREDAALTDCWGVELYDALTGDKIVGVEDIDYDPLTGTLYLSAYDRRAVAREVEAGGAATQGGIFTLSVDQIGRAKRLGVNDITQAFKDAGNEFRPHGIFLGMSGNAILAINRQAAKPGDEKDFTPALELFLKFDDGWGRTRGYVVKGMCDPFDVVFRGAGEVISFIYTDVTGTCRDGETLGGVFIYSEGNLIPLLDGVDFPNGLALTDKFLAVAETRSETIQLLSLGDKTGGRLIELPIAPDNLTVDYEGNLYAAGFTNLVDYYFYMKGWFWVGKSPSAVIRIDPADKFRQTLMFKDNGEMISGATVAQRAGDTLVMGSAWDDNIAVCRGMNSLKENERL